MVFQPKSSPVLTSPPPSRPTPARDTPPKSSPVPAAALKRPRDLRIDFFRGVALIGIAIDHMAPPPAFIDQYGHYQFGQIFSFNFADVFVFVSGFVCAIAYASTLRDKGWWGAQKKALGRCREIYGIYWLVLVVTVAVMAVLQAVGGEVSVIPMMRFDPLALFDARTLLRATLMRPPYSHFGILEFYVVMLTLMPTALWLYGRKPWLAAGASLAVYAYAQAAGHWNLAGLEAMRGPFGNYLAWQFLFFGGLFLSAEVRRGRVTAPSVGQALALVGFLLLIDYFRQGKWMYHHLNDKEQLGPLRVAELLAVTGILSRCMPADAAFLRGGLGGAIGRAGKHGLGVFAWTLLSAYVLTYSSSALHVGRAGYLVMVLLAAAGTVGCGVILDARAKPKRATPPGSADATVSTPALSERFNRAA